MRDFQEHLASFAGSLSFVEILKTQSAENFAASGHFMETNGGKKQGTLIRRPRLERAIACATHSDHSPTTRVCKRALVRALTSDRVYFEHETKNLSRSGKTKTLLSKRPARVSSMAVAWGGRPCL